MKAHDWISIIISITALAVSFYFAYQSRELSKKTHKLHIDPAIDCFFFKEQNSDTKFSFHIKNSGILDVVLLSVDYLSLTYNVRDNFIMSSETQLSPYEKIGKNWFFIPQLAPMQVDKKIIDLPSMQITNQLKNLKIQNTNEELQDLISSLHNSIEIFYFRIKYFRDADRNEYNKNCVYFLDKGELVDEKIIKNKSYYNKMMEQSRRFLEGMDKLPYFKR